MRNNELVESITRKVMTRILSEAGDKQWQHEIRIFFNSIRKGRYEVMGDTIYVPYTSSEDDSRYISYTCGDLRLRDDNYMIQHSDVLNRRQLFVVSEILRDNGVDCYDDE